MASAVGRRGGHRHAAVEFHSFPVHNNEAEFPSDLMYETDYSQDSDCNEDFDSPIGTQVPVDYTDLEVLHQHRRGHQTRSQRIARGISEGAGTGGSGGAATGGSGAAQAGCLGGAQGGICFNSQQPELMPAGSGSGSGCGSGAANRGQT